MKPYYSDSSVRIYNGDCLAVLASFGANCCSLVVTDPPFGVDYQSNHIKNKKQKLIGDGRPFSYEPWALHVYRLLRDDTALFAYTRWDTYAEHVSNLATAGFCNKEPLIAQKAPTAIGDVYGTFQPNADWVIFAHKGRFKFRQTSLIKNQTAGKADGPGRFTSENKTRMPSCWFGDEYPWSTKPVGYLPQLRHPTMKSVDMIKWLIMLSTDPGDIIIDPFMGSGTALVAARYCNRRAIGIEISKEYCDMAVERLSSGFVGV